MVLDKLPLMDIDVQNPDHAFVISFFTRQEFLSKRLEFINLLIFIGFKLSDKNKWCFKQLEDFGVIHRLEIKKLIIILKENGHDFSYHHFCHFFEFMKGVMLDEIDLDTFIFQIQPLLSTLSPINAERPAGIMILDELRFYVRGDRCRSRELVKRIQDAMMGLDPIEGANADLFRRRFTQHILNAYFAEQGFNPEIEEHKAIARNTFSGESDCPDIVLQTALSIFAKEQFFKNPALLERTVDDDFIQDFFKLSFLTDTLKTMTRSAITAGKLQARLPAGPLQQTASTLKLIELISQLAFLNFQDVIIGCNQFHQWIIQLPNRKEIINLTLLLKNVNMTHFDLSDAIADEFFQLIDTLNTKKDLPYDDLFPPHTKTPSALKLALTLYTGQNFYKNINALFRGESFSTLCENDEALQENYQLILQYLVIGCLSSAALNRLSWIQTRAEKQTVIEQLVRYESLTEHDVKCRTSQVYRLPALTSTTANLMNQFRGSHVTFFRGLPDYLQSIELISTHRGDEILKDSGEKEVLLLPGEQLVVQVDHGQAHRMTAQIVRTPVFDRDNYWGDRALNFADAKHLSQPYQDCPENLTLNGVTIARPNHGRPHTKRVMQLLPYVIDYFCLHAKDADFREFCRSMSKSDFDWLNMATAFSVTGRESEWSTRDHFEACTQYRINCTLHFKHFVDALEPKRRDAHHSMKARFSDVILHLCHPDHQSRINPSLDQDEKNQRYYYQSILSLAHVLDTARCLNAQAYDTRMQFLDHLVIRSDAQFIQLHEMMRYAVALIKAHGDRLFCDFLDLEHPYRLVDCHYEYRDPFALMNSDARALEDLTASVVIPFALQVPASAQNNEIISGLNTISFVP